MPSLNFSTNVELTQKQTLTLTPQLQQAIKILNMTSQELDLEIQNILSHNVMLKLDDGLNYEQLAPSEDDYEYEEKDVLDFGDLGEELPYDSSWEEQYSDDWKDGCAYNDDANLEEIYAQQENLENYLIEQINHLKKITVNSQAKAYLAIDDGIKNTAIALIYHIDRDGYLREN